MSSPMRTFSPSDRCLDAGCMVHQQDSPDQKIKIKSNIESLFALIIYNHD